MGSDLQIIQQHEAHGSDGVRSPTPVVKLEPGNVESKDLLDEEHSTPAAFENISPARPTTEAHLSRTPSQSLALATAASHTITTIPSTDNGARADGSAFSLLSDRSLGLPSPALSGHIINSGRNTSSHEFTQHPIQSNSIQSAEQTWNIAPAKTATDQGDGIPDHRNVPNQLRTPDAQFPLWITKDRQGNDMGFPILFYGTFTKVYPIFLTSPTDEAWLCPIQGCERHYDHRYSGLKAYRRKTYLVNHAKTQHRLLPTVPSNIAIPASNDRNDAWSPVQEGPGRNKSASAGPFSAPVRSVAPDLNSVKLTPVEPLFTPVARYTDHQLNSWPPGSIFIPNHARVNTMPESDDD